MYGWTHMAKWGTHNVYLSKYCIYSSLGRSFRIFEGRACLGRQTAISLILQVRTPFSDNSFDRNHDITHIVSQ